MAYSLTLNIHQRLRYVFWWYKFFCKAIGAKFSLLGVRKRKKKKSTKKAYETRLQNLLSQ